MILTISFEGGRGLFIHKRGEQTNTNPYMSVLPAEWPCSIFVISKKQAKPYIESIIGFGFYNNVVCKNREVMRITSLFGFCREGLSLGVVSEILSFDLDDHSPVGRQRGCAFVGYFENEVYGFPSRIVGHGHLAA